MSFEQAGAGQPETKPYETELQDDVRAAFEEVTSKAPAETEGKAPEPKVTDTETKLEAKTDAERQRDEQGRFTKQETKAAEAKPAEKPVQAKQEPVQQPIAQQAPVQPAKPQGNPPASWGVQAKGQWDRLPAVVRDEITRAVTAPPAAPAAIAPFLERAGGEQGLAQALNAYVGIEDLLRRDVGAGFLHIANNTGLTQHQQGQLFAALAQRLGAMPGSSGQQMPAQNGHEQPPPDLMQQLGPALQPLMQRQQQLEQFLAQQTEAMNRQRQSGAMSAIEQFRQSPEHRYYDNLEGQIGDLLEKGVIRRTGDYNADLKAAYDLACRMDPEVSEILINEKFEKTRADKEAAERQAAEKARSASRSITGSVSPGHGLPNKQGLSYDDDLNADVMAAVRMHSGRA